ncbi:ATP-grasp domain-containing protein [Streptacidiphilus jiangxiensis]|uniref:Biotin carboxylase n=1 Tax=Streptacidiphilus jiangxiensis TaxID=235985 RepID=A0A1H7VP80_STRJI|nr:ATP-grasp domain-containing protein [Streptacidiphilus jiangxiensis]SEM10980.1 Biotin carboxylase [Streptacidiphilus jiangxiensis]
MAPTQLPHLLIVNSGRQEYREYSFESLSRRFRLSAVLPAGPTWQDAYLDRAVVTDTSDPAALGEALAQLGADGPGVGVLTWDETVLEVTAQAAEKLGLPHMSAAAAAHCRDKYRTRSLMAEAGLPSVRYRLVTSEDEALAAAEELGLPVVVKPRALAGSMGVVLAEDEQQVRDAYTLAAAVGYADLPTGHGVLVEEFLDGPEVAIDSAVLGSRVRSAYVAKKELAFAPYFEEVGHLVSGFTDEPWQQEARLLVRDAHRALGVEHGVTHAEVRMTAAGPRLVELNGRLGGGLIPWAGQLATGIDLVGAAGDLAVGKDVLLTPDRHRTAGIRFLYPPFDCTVREIDLAGCLEVPGVVRALTLAGPGTALRLPPKEAIPRLAVLVTVADDEDTCRRVLDEAEQRAVCSLEPLA